MIVWCGTEGNLVGQLLDLGSFHNTINVHIQIHFPETGWSAPGIRGDAGQLQLA